MFSRLRQIFARLSGDNVTQRSVVSAQEKEQDPTQFSPSRSDPYQYFNKTVVADSTGRLLAYTYRKSTAKEGEGNNYIEVCKENAQEMVLRFDDPEGEVFLQRGTGEEFPLEVDAALHEMIHVVVDSEIKIRLGRDSIGRIALKEKNGQPGKIMIELRDIGDNFACLEEGVFSLGKMVVEIDPLHNVYISDETGRSCEITGERGAENLKKFRAGVD